MARSQRKIAGDETVHYVSARRQRERKKKRRSTAIQPPLTPMIDIVFQLLLFFLLACQFRADEGHIAANLPDISGPPPRTISIEPIDITLRATGSENLGVLITVQHTDAPLTTAEELHNYLLQMKQRHGKKADEVPVTIKPLGNVRWMHVVNAFNQAIRADYKKVGFKPSE
ncbi:MAG: biopolymer transporter ExbD [Planctomycetota bacterium]|nr:biopolymer transporter ExbD [Planctomycetota bacterium]